MAAINERHGLWLRRSPGNGPYAASEKLEQRRSRERFPKNLECGTVGKILYKSAAADPIPTFSTSSSSSSLAPPNPQP